MTDEEKKGLTLAELVGVPYKDHGRDLTGLDCYGLAILAVYIITGKTLNDVIYNDHAAELSDRLAPTLNIKPATQIKAGDLLEMTFNKEIHIGVIINDREFIHSTYNMGVKISPIKNAPIKNIYEVV